MGSPWVSLAKTSARELLIFEPNFGRRPSEDIVSLSDFEE